MHLCIQILIGKFYIQKCKQHTDTDLSHRSSMLQYHVVST